MANDEEGLSLNKIINIIKKLCYERHKLHLYCEELNCVDCPIYQIYERELYS